MGVPPDSTASPDLGTPRLDASAAALLSLNLLLPTVITEDIFPKDNKLPEKEAQSFYGKYAQLEMIYYGLLTAATKQKEKANQEQRDKMLWMAYYAALILRKVYADLLVCHQLDTQIKRDIAILKTLLNIPETETETEKNLKEEKWLLPICLRVGLREVRTYIFRIANTVRLWLVRLNRALSIWSQIFKGLTAVSVGMQQFLAFIYFSVIGVVIYLLRLLPNLWALGGHVIGGFWMDPEEKALGWWLRLQVQWERRGSQILNDAVWAGINLTCILVAPQLALTLTVLLYVFDVLVAGWMYYVAYRHIQDIEKRISNNNGQKLDADAVDGIKLYARGQVLRDKGWQLGIAVIFLVAMIILLPALSAVLSPAAVLWWTAMAGLVNLAVTTGQVTCNDKITAQTPSSWKLSTTAQSAKESKKESNPAEKNTGCSGYLQTVQTWFCPGQAKTSP